MKIPLGEQEEAEFEMAPMIDMVFLLLIFFMCASHMSVLQNIELDIPTADKAVVPRDRPNRFIINIRKDGELFSGNIPTDIAGLKDMVKVHKEEAPDLKVYLRADKETAHRHVKKVMAVMAEAGIDDFIFGAFIPSN